jgi:transcriptional regulator with XRE-family HTH domain
VGFCAYNYLFVGRNAQKIILPHRKLIGDAIRHYRKQAKLTQEQLAEKSNLNPKYLGEVERGEKIISIEALLRIAHTVETPMKKFFEGL